MFHFPANARSGRLPGGASVRVRDLAAGATVLLVLLASGDGLASGPTISFSTYFGSSGSEAITGVAVDAAGNIYVTGWTESAGLPIVNAAQATFGGSVDAFVAKFDPTGSTLLYSTFLGGSGDDRSFAIAVDASGNAYITGWTYSTNFPVTASAAQSHLSSGRDAFVAKLSPSGNQLLYSTYLGGYGSDAGRAIAVDGSGNVYLAGETTSWNFPSLLSVQSSLKGAQNAFITSLNASGQLRFSTWLGGSGTDGATAVAVDGSGNVYVTGGTTSLDFPVTVNAFQRTSKGYQNVFVSSIAAAGNTLLYSTYLGGSGATVIYPETGFGIDVDAAGSAYVTGVTASSDFPTQNALQPALSGSLDAFVTKLNPAGTALVFSTFLGGSSIDEGNAIRVSNGAPCIAGYTASLDYPVVNPVQAANAGSYDAVLSCLNAAGNAITFSTLLGGTDSDSADALALSGGFGYVAGLTFSRNFPVAGAHQPLNGGQEDGFLAKLFQVPPPLPAIPAPTLPANGAAGVVLNPTLSWTASSTATSYAVDLGTSNPPPLLGTATGNSYSPGTLSPATTYYWQVTATNAVGSVNSGIWSFTTLACTYALGAVSAATDANGGAASVSVTSFTGCGWTATSNATWLTVSAGASGNGNGTVSYSVAANITANARSGMLTIGGQTFTVNQGGAGCTYALNPTGAAPNANGGAASVSVTSPTGCGWTATSNATWLTVSAGASGNGNGTVNYTVSANTTANARSGALTIGVQTFTVNQGGVNCSYALNPTGAAPDANGGAASVSVTSPTGCGWTATSNASWLAVTAGAAGNGSGTVNYSVSANTTANARSGTLTIGGQTFTVNQGGVSCTYALNPAGATPSANGGGASVSVASPTGCGWTAASNASWLAVTAGASGNGNGTVSYSAAANTTANARSGTLTVAAQTFTVNQGGVGCTYALNPTSAAAGPSGGGAAVSVASPTGCGWTATSNATWLTVTAGASGNGNGTVSYSVTANGAAQSRAATITVGNSSLAVTQAGIPQSSQPPSIASLSPFAGSGNQTFTLGFSDPSGWVNIAHAYLLINVQVWVAASCYVDYSIGANSISLMNDAGTAWLGPIVAGSAASVANSQCTVSGIGTSASGQGNNLTVNLALSFQASYDGGVPKKNIFLMAADYAGLTADWLAFGIWYPAPLTSSLITRYRLYFPVTLEHLYTTDLNEYNVLGTEGWNQEGADAAVYNGPAAVSGVSTEPMWRLYYTTNMTHMWTTDRNEYLTLMTGYGGAFIGEGADEFLFPVQVASSIPLYRLLFNGSGPPIHHWTTDAYEFSVLTAPGGGWTSEGIPGYLFPPAMAGSLQAEKIVNYSLEPGIHKLQAHPQPLDPGSPPAIGAILNGASYQTGPASPGQTVSLFGLFPARGGVRVVIGGSEAEVLSVTEREIQAVVPGNITAARIPVTVIAGGRRSNAVELELGVAAPAVFATDPYGRGQAQAVNQDGTPNGATNPAPAGSVVTMTLTGDGNQAISVRIAGRPADVVSVTMQGSGKTGLRVRIPEGLPAGSTAPVRVKAGEFFSQSGVTLAVR